MMILLFMVALFLAWPTAGLSIVAFLIVAFIRMHLKVKARMHYADEAVARKSMERGSLAIPAWARNESEREVFPYAVAKLATRRGIPEMYTATFLNTEARVREVINLSGQMERQGSSFIAQQLATTDFIERTWNDLNQAEQKRIKETAFQEHE